MRRSRRGGRLFSLSEHFFHALFDLGVLNEDGADAFTRVLLGSLAIIVSLGLLLTRMFLGKYAALSLLFRSEGGPAKYREALLADNTLVLGLAMWIVATVTVLISHSLFPDETDFRILAPLPIHRRLIFGAKLLALTAFAGIFIATTLIALTPLMVMMASGRWAGHAVAAQLLAYLGAGIVAALFVVFAVAAINGLALVVLPRSRVHEASTILRSVMLCALVLAAPLVFQLPALGPRLVGESRWLFLAPPVWFVGIERWLLGEQTGYLVRLAEIGAAAVASAALAGSGSYVILYARFDRIMVRTFSTSRWGVRLSSLAPRRRRRPGFSGILDFTHAALRRSALHQGIVMAVTACGAGFVINSLLGSRVFVAVTDPDQVSRTVFTDVTWAPGAVIFAAALAVRSAIVVPVEPRANWLFRMTEHDETRAEQLDAVASVMRWIAVALPVALTLPLQLRVLGIRGFMTAAIAALCGLVLVEIHLRDWRRIPFTCSYLPGKRAVTNTVLIGLVAFAVYTGFTGALARSSYDSPARGCTAVALLAVVVAILRRNRLAKWSVMPLMFEDLMPGQLEPLGLPRD